MANGSITIDVLLNNAQAQSGLQSLQQQGGKLPGVFGAITTAATVAAGAIAGIGAVAVSTFLDAENASVKLQNQLGIGAERAQDLTNIARNIYNKGFGQSLGEVTDALSKVRQNIGFLNNEDLEQVTNQAIGLAQTFDADVNEVTRAAANIAKAYGIEAQQAFDLLAYGAQNGLNYSNELFDNVAEYIPLFEQYGYTAEEAFAFLINGGQQAAYNLDYVNDIVKEFGIRAQDASTTTADAFAKLGGDAELAFQAFQRGEISVQQLSTVTASALSEIDDALTVNSIGVDLFGTKFEDLGSDVALSLFTSSTAIGDFAGSADEILANLADTTQFRFDSIVRTITGFLEPIGNKIVIAIDETLQGVVSTFNRYSSRIYDTAIAVWEEIQPFIQRTLTTISTFLSKILGDIVIFWQNNGDRIMNIVTTAWTVIQTVFETVLPIILGVVTFIWNAIVDVIEGAIGVIDGIIKAFSAIFRGDFTALWEAVKQIFQSSIQLIIGLLTLNFVGSIRTLLTNFATATVTTIKNLWTNITTSFSTSITRVTSSVGDLVRGLGQLFRNLYNDLTGTISSLSTSVVNTFKSTATNVLNAFKNLPSQFIQFGRDIINGLINGIRSIDVVAIVADIASSMVSSVKSALSIFSPSRVFKSIGEDINAGWEIGLTGSASDVIGAVDKTTSGIIEGAMNATNLLSGAMNNLQPNLNGLMYNGVASGAVATPERVGETKTQINNVTVQTTNDKEEYEFLMRRLNFGF